MSWFNRPRYLLEILSVGALPWNYVSKTYDKLQIEIYFRIARCHEIIEYSGPQDSLLMSILSFSEQWRSCNFIDFYDQDDSLIKFRGIWFLHCYCRRDAEMKNQEYDHLCRETHSVIYHVSWYSPDRSITMNHAFSVSFVRRVGKVQDKDSSVFIWVSFCLYTSWMMFSKFNVNKCFLLKYKNHFMLCRMLWNTY